ncbi:ankyrin repeat-containing domain protein [Apodospora peruviana]|uniref:Ankyrin repeat-containing domain protein n=1 Tax=Apodospora peruviana TaxID=516989 RepID=A0AAE0I019_9PEZI|nr:ankyrin repeat-containing domain protein [Apodospora peruviana]
MVPMAAHGFLTGLPNELHFMIGEYLINDTNRGAGAIAALSLTCRRFNAVFESGLYKHNAKHNGGSAMAWGAGRGQIGTMEKALNSGADPNTVRVPLGSMTGCLWHPLHYAARFGHDNVVEWLLDHGSYTDHVDEHLEYAIKYALEEGHVSTAKLLVSREVRQSQPRVTERSYGGAMITAAKYGHAWFFDTTGKTSRTHPFDLETLRNWSRTVMIEACDKHSNVETVTALIKLGVRDDVVDETAPWGSPNPSPLGWAALYSPSPVETVSVLLEAGFRRLKTRRLRGRDNLRNASDYANSDGESTPGMYCACWYTTELSTLEKEQQPLFKVLDWRWNLKWWHLKYPAQALAMFFRHGLVDPNSQDWEGNTLLHFVFLLFNRPDHMWEPEFELDAEAVNVIETRVHQRGRLLDVLLSHGASLSIKNDKGKTVLDVFMDMHKFRVGFARFDLEVLKIMRMVLRAVKRNPSCMTPEDAVYWTSWTEIKTAEFRDSSLTSLDTNTYGAKAHVLDAEGNYDHLKWLLLEKAY